MRRLVHNSDGAVALTGTLGAVQPVLVVFGGGATTGAIPRKGMRTLHQASRQHGMPVFADLQSTKAIINGTPNRREHNTGILLFKLPT
jgi:hypothetical protein